MEFSEYGHLFHTFCHIRDERSFDFAGQVAILCHRCSGIYSGFLLCFLLALGCRWNGRWTASGSKYQPYWSAAMLLALCGLQVLIQKFDGGSGGGGLARFAIGAGVGLALTQGLMAQGFLGILSKTLGMETRETTSGGAPPSRSKIMMGSLLLLLPIHLYASSHSFAYHAWTVLPGLCMLYISVNLTLLEEWVSKSPLLIKLMVVLCLVALEWYFLYYMNIARHQHV